MNRIAAVMVMAIALTVASGCGAPLAEADSLVLHWDARPGSSASVTAYSAILVVRKDGTDCLRLGDALVGATATIDGHALEFRQGGADIVDGCSSPSFIGTFEAASPVGSADAEVTIISGSDTLVATIRNLYGYRGPRPTFVSGSSGESGLPIVERGVGVPVAWEPATDLVGPSFEGAVWLQRSSGVVGYDNTVLTTERFEVPTDVPTGEAVLGTSGNALAAFAECPVASCAAFATSFHSQSVEVR